MHPKSPSAARRPAGRLRRALVVIALGAGMIASTAAYAPPADGADLRGAAERIAQARELPGDRELLLAHPEIAAKVIDPSRTVTTTESAGKTPAEPAAADGPSTFAATAQQAWCQGYWVDNRVNSVLGFLIWQWRHYIEVCMDGNSILQWNQDYDYLVQADVTVLSGPLIAEARDAAGGWIVTSVRQRQLQQCIATVGCWATDNPGNEIQVAANGNYNYYRFGSGF